MSAPTVSSISPSSGPLSGGVTVTIVGNNFDTTALATTVSIGGNAATSVSVTDANTLTCTTPSAIIAGTASVVVTTTGGGGSNTDILYTYQTAPTVTGVTPPSGPLGSTSSVAIAGTNFIGATGVTFGGTAATSIIVVSPTLITCTAPSASSAATVSVVVTTPSGTNSANSLFTYQTAPTVTGISLSSGPLTGGRSVTLTGTNFIGATGVTIGGNPATSVTVTNSTTLTCTTPSALSAGTASVVVTTPSGANAGNSLYAYVLAPTVSSIATTGGITATSGTANGGTTVTITGTNFTGPNPFTPVVTFGTTAATSVAVATSTSLTCVTPSGSAGPASVLVTTPGGVNAANNFYSYVLTPPTVTDIGPAAGSSAGGTSVTITGTNFTGATAVTFRGVPAADVIVASPTTIVCTTPAGTAGAASVAVTTPSGAASSNLYTYVQPPPTVTGTSANAISPARGSTLGGTLVTITGTNFNGTGGVTIGGVPATNVTLIDSTTLTCITPPGSVDTVSVVVTTVGGTNADNSLFTYELIPPTVSTISPESGTSAGGTTITITGRSFTGTTGVTIDGTPATRLIVVNDTTLTCTTPVGNAGTPRSVVVTTPNGPSTDNVTFTYVLALPTVTSVSPPIGPTSGSTTVTIKGTYFTGDTDHTGAEGVTIGGLSATNFKVVDATTITCTTPAGLAGTASVQVTAAAGTSAANSLFTFVTTTPTDTYIYLKGGRGDGFVPQWTGQLAEEGTTEKGEPYRNEFQSTAQLDNSASASSGFTTGSNAYWGLGSSSANGSNSMGFGGQMTTPGHLTKIVVTKEIVGNTAQAVNITPVFGSLSDSVSGAAPRQFDKTATWMVFISSNGLGYKFRKTDVVGWGSQRRD